MHTLNILPRPLAVLPETLPAHGTGSFNNADYQAYKRKHPELVSASRLKHYAISPLAGHLADLQPEETTDAMRFGSLFHAYLLQPETIGTLFLAEDKEVELKKDGTPYADGRQSAAQKTRWAEAEAEGKQVNTTDDHALAASMASAAAEALLAYHPSLEWDAEQTLWAPIPATNNVLIGQADLVSTYADTIVDAKSIADAKLADSTLINQCFTYGYHIQAGVYSMLYAAVMGRPLQNFIFAFVSKQPPVHSKLLILDRLQLDKCETDALQALNNLLEAQDIAREAKDDSTDIFSHVLPTCKRTLYYEKD